MKIAVIGAGISGLSASLILSKRHDVHLFESDTRFGGHAHTVNVDVDGKPIPADTGFLVYNELNYPHLTALFKYLGVETAPSNMSLSISLVEKNLEWCGTSLSTVFGQRRNIFRLSFHRMLLELLRFHREADENLELSKQNSWTLGQLLDEKKYSRDFRNHYLLPMSAAIWSTPEKGMLDFPAATFLQFCHNHRLLQVNQRPQWRTVKNGSINYVNEIVSRLQNVHLGTAVNEVVRLEKGIAVRSSKGEMIFDKVLFATHAPVTARLLQSKSDLERDILGCFRTEPNHAVLHRDRTQMPRKKRVWSAWNVNGSSGGHDDRKVSLTYYLNTLQPLQAKTDLFLTLNPWSEIPKHDFKTNYNHPLFDRLAIEAQKNLSQIQGVGGVYYAGAWTANGFHEDGLLSAIKVCEMLGEGVPWAAHIDTSNPIYKEAQNERAVSW